MDLIISFTGTRRGMTQAQFQSIDKIMKILSHENSIEGHHGDCVGADVQFHQILVKYRCRKYLHPAKVHSSQKAFSCDYDILYPEKPPLTRNRDMVDTCHLLLATPKETKEVLRSGTWSTIRYAEKIDKYHIIIWPNGNLEDFLPKQSNEEIKEINLNLILYYQGKIK